MINFDGLGGFWSNIEIRDGGPKWPPLKNDDVISTSSAHFADLKDNSFRSTIYPKSLIVIVVNALEVLKGGGGGGAAAQILPPFPRFRDEKKARLNRVKKVSVQQGFDCTPLPEVNSLSRYQAWLPNIHYLLILCSFLNLTRWSEKGFFLPLGSQRWVECSE